MVGRTSAPPSGAKPLTKLFMLLMAAALCLGLMPIAPAWADEPAPDAPAPQAAEQTVTLTVLAGTTTDYTTGVTTYNTWVNKKYAFKEGATVEDLLNAAVEAGDLKAYDAPESSYGGKNVGSITSAKGIDLKNWNSDDFSVSLYWSYYENGAYGQGDCAIDHRELKAGTNYQLAWNKYSSADDNLTSADWDAYYEKHPVAGESADTVTLSLVAGSKSDPNTYEMLPVIWLNKAYQRADVLAVAKERDANATLDTITLEDLLNTAVKAGDIKSYAAPEGTYGKAVESITSKEGVKMAKWDSADFSVSLYWASYRDGGYGGATLDKELLKGANAFQFAWTIYSSANAPADAAAWAAYYQDNPPAAAGSDAVLPGGEEPVEPPTSEHPATGVSQAAVGSLMTGIVASYAGTSDPWVVMSLAALDRDEGADLDAFYAEALAQAKDPGFDPTALQRSIIALTAAGYDARALADSPAARAAGDFDAIAALGSRVSGSTLPNARMAALWAYASGDYAVPADAALSKDALIASVLADQQPGGGFALSGAEANADMTAMAISALAPYRDNPEVRNAVNRALVALKGIQLPTGGFADNDGLPNACSTAFAVIALCAAGIDPATEWAVESGATPFSALLAYGLQDNSGFAFEAGGDRDENATEQGLRALVAYRGLKAAGANGDYNLYAQAREGGVTIPSAEGQEPPKQEQPQPQPEAPADGDKAGAGSAKGTPLAPTGDAAPAGAAAVVALAAAAASVVALRRREVA